MNTIDAPSGPPLRHHWAMLLLLALTLLLELPGFTTLPPMDRDEPRFAQASKQMLETGDYVDIRFQGEARNKKPVGIYWLQAAAVAAGEAAGIADARRTIWLYRLPSLLGAVTAVLATYWAGLAVASCRAALAGAALLAATVILTVEAHLATTDAVLCATVVIAMGSLLRLYLTGPAADGSRTLRLPAIFWTAIAVGILIKGPITPMVPALAAAVLCIRDRSAAWLKPLRPALGLAWVLLLVMPWLVLILIRTHGAFLTEAVGGDMLGKATGGREAHGAPPGAYLAAFWISAWPLAPFALLAAPQVWRERAKPPVAALLAWLVPTWLLFELVPTKLPHYVLPVYPAVALLAARTLEAASRERQRPRWLVVLVLVLLALVPLGLAGALLAGHDVLWSRLPAGTLALGGLAAIGACACAAWAVRRLLAGAWPSAVAATCLAAAIVYAFTLGHLLTPDVSNLLALSPRLAAAAGAAVDPACRPARFASASDHEPSLVFLTGTDLVLDDAIAAAGFIKGAPCRGVLVDSRAEQAFRDALGDAADVMLAGRVEGTVINAGKHLDIGIYVRQESRP